MTDVRPHAWAPSGPPAPSYWEQRTCPLCGLTDTRARDLRTRRASDGTSRDWSVNTPCIEPVAVGYVTYNDLVREMADHHLDERPYVTGRPGDWRVGLGRGNNYPRLGVSTLEEAWAALTQWLRARQYNPRMYSNYDKALSDAAPSYTDDDD